MSHLPKKYFYFLSILAIFFLSSEARGEGASGGRGGPFIEAHAKPITSFDQDLLGNMVVVGGKGVGVVGKNFRIGGAGGGGFAWGASENLMFGLGYGGVLGEYIVAPWLTASLMIGGGGFSVGKMISETETTMTFKKISSGAFLLFYPSISAEVRLKNNIILEGRVGYFLPSNYRLQSISFSVGLLFGKG